MKTLLPASLLALAAASAASASPFDEARFGVLSHGAGVIAPDKEPGAAINAELLLHPIEALSFIGAPRPHIGMTIATEGNTDEFYAGLTWEQNFNRFFVNGSFGIGFHDGRTDFSPFDTDIGTTQYLGCRALFRFSGDVGFRLTKSLSASLYTSHISNAGLCSENEGLDQSGVRLGYRF